MEKQKNTIDLGARRVQKGGHTYIFNIPVVAVRTLGLRAGSTLRVLLSPDGTLHLTKNSDDDAIPIRGGEMDAKWKK